MGGSAHPVQRASAGSTLAAFLTASLIPPASYPDSVKRLVDGVSWPGQERARSSREPKRATRAWPLRRRPDGRTHGRCLLLELGSFGPCVSESRPGALPRVRPSQQILSFVGLDPQELFHESERFFRGQLGAKLRAIQRAAFWNFLPCRRPSPVSCSEEPTSLVFDGEVWTPRRPRSSAISFKRVLALKRICGAGDSSRMRE